MLRSRLGIAIVSLGLVGGVGLSGAALAAAEVADAAMRGDQPRVAELIESGADVNAAQPDGATALHWAAYRGDIGTLQSLVSAGADVAVANRAGTTPLLLAAVAGDPAVIRALLDAGADANDAFANGETALMMAARTGNAGAIEVLIERGADIDARESLRGTTALMWAAAYSNPVAVRVLLDAGADFAAQSSMTARGRRPYLAPTARSRIDEYERGTGLRGAALNFRLGAGEDENAEAEEAAAEVEAAAIAAVEAEESADPAETDGEEGEGASPSRRRAAEQDWGGLTPLIFATREGDMESAQLLVEAGADVNQTSAYGWTPLLTATQNRYYQLGAWFMERGADPNIANKGGWTPLYIATDNRNIEGGDYPTRAADMDHMAYIRMLLDHGANPNLRMQSSTETRTIFTHQWLHEEGATAFLRAAQSGDIDLMNLLLEHGADPSIATDHGVTPLMVASGIGWVEGVTHEWSPEQTLEAVRLLLDVGADVNAQDTVDGRTALMGAAHKGRNDVIEVLVEHGADLAVRDIGSRDSIHMLAGVTWQAIDYADGLVRVGVQSAIPHPETAALLRRLMEERGLAVPEPGRTLDSICVTDLCR